MKNYRVWGQAPYNVAVVHGGPGAPGSMAAVARDLSVTMGVLEPLQTKDSMEGQIQELCEVLGNQANIPVILVGHSWGAWLSYLVAARNPNIVKKLILVGSGPFEQKYAENITPERLKRLTESERVEVFSLIDVISGESIGDKDKSMGRLGQLFASADTYKALTAEQEPEPLAANEEINRKVWREGEALRTGGELLEMGRQIKCPVIAVHGDYDPHPAEGVKEPLSRVLRNFKFVLLKKCGHEPWQEKYAREEFFQVLREAIA
jgi:pimeloyl-ACP methyl ester carboxylesterase